MKRSLLFSSIALFTLGTFAFLQAQEREESSTSSPETSTDTRVPSPPVPSKPGKAETKEATPAQDASTPEEAESSRSGEEKFAESESGKAEAAPAGKANIPGIRTDVIATRKSGDEELVVAPLGSVFVVDESYFVLAKGAESDVDFRQTEVTLGKTDGLVVEITEGLQPGDEVITVATDQLRFPAFAGDGEFGACGPASCPIDAKNCDPVTGACPTGKECDLFMTADEYFDGDVMIGYGPAPSFGGGPGFCPPF